MYHGYVWSDILHFIGLQVSDKVPLDVFGEVIVFTAKFCTWLSPKTRCPAAYASSMWLFGMVFGHGHQPDTAGKRGRDTFYFRPESVTWRYGFNETGLCFGEFRFLVRFGFVMEHVHNRRFCNRGDFVVGHGAFHSFVKAFYGIAQIRSLYQHVLVAFPFPLRFFIKGDESHFGFEPTVGRIFVRFEQFGVFGPFDVCHLKFAGHERFYFFYKTSFGFSEAQGIYQIGLRDFLDQAVF